jgi:gluconolactonase
MKRAIDTLSSIRPFVISVALLAGACAGADEADDTPTFTPSNAPGLGGAGQVAPAAGVGGSQAPAPSVGAGGAGSGVTGANTEGNGGNIAVAPGGSNPGVGSGSGGSPPASGSGGSAPVGAAGSSMVGTGGSASAPPPVSGGPRRVGAELCPAGPFGNPLPANPQFVPLAAVPDNNFFILEGPVWVGDALYLSEIGPGNVSQIDRFTLPRTFERGVFTNTGSNGLAVDAGGDLVLAAHDVGGISRLTLPGGAITRGNQKRNGQRFNSPNDLVIRGDDNIYFTDPDFQSPSGRIQGGTFVYRIAPPLGTGEITVVDQNVDNPNGVTLSPDGSMLYISASGVLREYSLDAAGVPTPAGDLVNGFNGGDGMAIDCAGNIYAVQNGDRIISVFSPAGERLGTIGPIGQQGVTNAAFGGPNRTTLFITTFSGNGNTGLFSVELNVPGLPY